ncbi:uncharacterized protein LOC126835249 [Adelges cooleyi]|uniref:uncharacterized protein LOC126835249 n=1 Tax=Adelges cooleyi TaxID=133065 RepID=UPI0021808009|nr:uncharacterized protein LOC126835249 [Adelges cooleyi]
MNLKVCIVILVLNIFRQISSEENLLNDFFDNLLKTTGYIDRHKSFLKKGIKDFSVGLFNGKDGRVVELSEIRRKGNIILHPGEVESWLEISFLVPYIEINWENSECIGIKCQLCATMIDNQLDVKMAVIPENCEVSYSISLKAIKEMEVYVVDVPKTIKRKD